MRRVRALTRTKKREAKDQQPIQIEFSLPSSHALESCDMLSELRLVSHAHLTVLHLIGVFVFIFRL